jgi:hypothetical protein
VDNNAASAIRLESVRKTMRPRPVLAISIRE